jgi:hypothetical protein
MRVIGGAGRYTPAKGSAGDLALPVMFAPPYGSRPPDG